MCVSNINVFVLFVFYCLLFVFYLHTRTLIIAIAIINVSGNNFCDKLTCTYYPLLIFNDHKNFF